MRNIILIFFLLFLPLQWSTAAVLEYRPGGEAALAGSAGDALGHADEEAHDVAPDAGHGDVKVWNEACGSGLHCHCVHALFRLPRLPSMLSFEPRDTPYGVFVPDPPPDPFQRPPQTVLA